MSNLANAEAQAALEVCARRIDQVREMSDIWLASVQRATEAGLQLAAQLARCNDSAEAAQLCRAWANECRDRFFADGRVASEMWLKFCRIEANHLMSAVSQTVQRGSNGADAAAAPFVSNPFLQRREQAR